MDIYEQLRTIGVSIETADALAPVLEKMPKRKQEAFILWAMGYGWGEICQVLRMSKRDLGGAIDEAIEFVKNKAENWY